MQATATEREIRALTVDAECRASERDGKKMISGYAAVFNSFSEDLGGFREIIRPGAFTAAIAEGQDVRALVDHEPSAIIGRTASGTLRLKEDKRGLHYEIDVPETQAGKDIWTSVKRGDVSGSSFSFTVRNDSDAWRTEGDQMIRELHSVDLYDVGPVTYPAYKATVSEAARRSLDKAKTEVKKTPFLDAARRRMKELNEKLAR